MKNKGVSTKKISQQSALDQSEFYIELVYKYDGVLKNFRVEQINFIILARIIKDRQGERPEFSIISDFDENMQIASKDIKEHYKLLITSLTKQQIILLIAIFEKLNGNQIADRLNLTNPSVYKHLQDLVKMGVIKSIEEKTLDGKTYRTNYSINKDKIMIMDHLQYIEREFNPVFQEARKIELQNYLEPYKQTIQLFKDGKLETSQ